VVETIANYVTPENECPCDRSLRWHELQQLSILGKVTTIPRRDAPVVKLDDLARLFAVASD
jgi:hypothetical protein